ncbi:Uncharacterised protein [Legionella busanensis]|uniref:Uncharacterized protein n=1 Tax=Legionella busanensis TaxID=190655 RepID=A0A378K9H2_9GAMM|nr:hypothetical protein [Legionella busanensis]STX81367.1 Uncharacterised protein [Legionella busanensis]
MLLTKLIGHEIQLPFDSTEEQLNDYDCGTRMVNAYRKAVDINYTESTHIEILQELLEKQMPKTTQQPLPNELFDDFSAEKDIELEEIIANLTEQELYIIEITTSAQIVEVNLDSYKENLKELFVGVKKQGLFANIKNPIDIATIDLTEANIDEGESDQEFAERLQEAEFRKVGLK